jgi:hypothetical protein
MTERKRTLPDWDDERGVARLADELIAKLERHARAFLDYGASAIAADEFAKFEHAEATAVKAALRGDVAPLARLLLDENWQWLQPETRKLMSEILLGKRIRSVGHPKMTAEERRATNPIHRAADEANILKSRLQKLYPGIARAAVRERAMEIVAKRTGVSLEALRRQLRRSSKDPHRIS